MRSQGPIGSASHAAATALSTAPHSKARLMRRLTATGHNLRTAPHFLFGSENLAMAFALPFDEAYELGVLH